MEPPDDRDTHEEHTESEAQAALGDLVIVVAALHHRGRRARQRSDRDEHFAATEQVGSGGVDPAADGTDDVGEHREQAQQTEDRQADRERVDPMIGELLGQLVTPDGTGLDAGLSPLPSARGL